ncbi:WD repeat-containing protein WRAP73, partial [Tremellales sp. Uapishka_1]
MSTGYDFSQIYPSSVLSFSPGSSFLATAVGNRLIVRSTSTLKIVKSCPCLLPSSSAEPIIDQILWSGDSMYLLLYSIKSGLAWVFGLAEEGEGELARIGGEGVEGLSRVEWGRVGRQVLAWSDFGLRITIYDLTCGQARCIQHPKSSVNCHSYAPDGRHLAVAEHHGGKDHIGIYDVHDSYALVRHFQLRTTDVQGIAWSPCGKWIAAYDSLLSYSLDIHSPLGAHLAHFSFTSASFSPGASTADPGLGIRLIAWAPGGQHLAIGGYDGKVRILESEGWRCVAVMSYEGRTSEKNTTIWREPVDWLRETRGRGIVQFDKLPSHSSLPTNRTAKPTISQIAFSPSSSLLLIRLDSSPNLIHIHTFLPNPITHHTTILFSDPVRAAAFSPKGECERVVVATRTGGVFFWEKEGSWVSEGEENDGLMEGVGIPSRDPFSVQETTWSPDGTVLAIQDKAAFCLLYDSEQAEQSNRWDGKEGLTEVLEEEEEEEEMTREALKLEQQQTIHTTLSVSPFKNQWADPRYALISFVAALDAPLAPRAPDRPSLYPSPGVPLCIDHAARCPGVCESRPTAKTPYDVEVDKDEGRNSAVLLFIDNSTVMPQALSTLVALEETAAQVRVVTEIHEGVECSPIIWRIGQDVRDMSGACGDSIWISEILQPASYNQSRGEIPFDHSSDITILPQPHDLLSPEVSHEALTMKHKDKWEMGLFSHVLPPDVFYPSKHIRSRKAITYFPLESTPTSEYPQLPWGRGWRIHRPSKAKPPTPKIGEDTLVHGSRYLRYWQKEEEKLAYAMRTAGVCLFEGWQEGLLDRRMVQAMLSGCVVATALPEVDRDNLEPYILALQSTATLPVNQMKDHLLNVSVSELKAKALHGFVVARQKYVDTVKVEKVLKTVELWKQGERGYMFPNGFRWSCSSGGTKPPWCDEI